MKNLILHLCLFLGLAANAQGINPVFELSTGAAIRHSEGFAVPRVNIAAHKLYKSFGVYTTFEQRNNVSFADDFNEDGNYQRYLIGPTYSVNRFLYVFAGLSPVGSYGLGGEGGFQKVRKEIGVAGVWKNYSLHLGYSKWVGFSIAAGYQFGIKQSNKSSTKKSEISPVQKLKEPEAK